MNLKQTGVMFFLLALISASILRLSEADDDEYCPTTEIDKVPGCYDALKLASDSDYTKLSRECCQAVKEVYPDSCFLKVYPGKAYPIHFFTTLCTNLFPGLSL